MENFLPSEKPDVKQENKPVSENGPSPFYRFFWWCSGSRIYIIQKSRSEWNKFAGIGAIVLLTGIMASMSGGYTLFTIFNKIPYSLIEKKWVN